MTRRPNRAPCRTQSFLSPGLWTRKMPPWPNSISLSLSTGQRTQGGPTLCPARERAPAVHGCLTHFPRRVFPQGARLYKQKKVSVTQSLSLSLSLSRAVLQGVWARGHEDPLTVLSLSLSLSRLLFFHTDKGTAAALPRTQARTAGLGLCVKTNRMRLVVAQLQKSPNPE